MILMNLQRPMKTHPSSPLAAVVFGFCLATFHLAAVDWPHWLGPDGSNRTSDPAFHADLSKYKPAWEAKIGRGYSSVIVAGGKAIVLGHDEKTGETVFCFAASTGKELWRHAYPAELLPRMHPGGPNASATVVGGRVLTISKDGQLFCLNVEDGSKQWETKLPAAMGIAVPQWGFGCSPVVSGQTVLASAGKVIALDLATGKTLWVTKQDAPAAYATPVPFTRNGGEYIAAMNGKGLSVLSAKDGTELSHRSMTAQFNLLATSPVVLRQGNRIFISGNASSELLAFDGQTLAPVWTSKDLRNALNESIVVGDTIYGIDGRQGTPARLVAINLADGKLRWAKESFGYGTTIGIGDTLLALTEIGELVTARMKPEGYQETGRLQILGKTCWTTPTTSNGRIYVRNDQGNLICLSQQ